MDLTERRDVTDILALLDSLPYDELDLETPRFRLTLRRTAHGWTQSTQVLSAPTPSPPSHSPPPSPHQPPRKRPRWNIVVATATSMVHRCRRPRARAGAAGG